ncbi:hypothetical protein MBLNU457_1313t2 [Dothideomycetes sp. NU457]
MDLVKRGLSIAQDHRQTTWIAPLLLLADVALCGLIIWKVPYTEIDWKAYMQQVAQYVAGQRNYSKIRGDTGPLVYPATHVYIYRLLYDVTDRGTDIRLAQYLFGVLYLLTLALVMACYRKAKVPPGLWTAGSVIYSVGVGVKMSLLLALPAVGILLLQVLGASGAFRRALLMVQFQLLTAWPFATRNWQNYFSRAFEFSRVFLFKWTVNWRFVGEDVFLSKAFSIGLLAVHGGLLTLFAATRWLAPSRMSVIDNVKSLYSPPLPQKQAEIASRVTPRFILTTILSANVIGNCVERLSEYHC